MNGNALIQRPPQRCRGWAWGSLFEKDQALARTQKKLPREAGGEIPGAFAIATEMASD